MPRLDWYIRAQLKLRHLQLLVALDDLRSVGRVAAHLNVTQSAVSKMLGIIEEGVEAPLFERTARGIEPTDYGVCLVRYAREIMDLLGHAHAEMQDIGEGRLTRVSLGVLPSTAISLVPRLVATLENEPGAGEVAVSVREGTMETLLPALRAGELDAVLGLLPAKPLGAEYSTERLYDDPTVTVVRRGHPLSRARKATWHDLARYPMVLPPRGSIVRSALDHFMVEHRVNVPRRHLESVSTLTNLGVIQQTDSVGFWQESIARHFAAQGAIALLGLALPSVSLSVGLIWMADRRIAQGQRRVHETLRRLAGEARAE